MSRVWGRHSPTRFTKGGKTAAGQIGGKSNGFFLCPYCNSQGGRYGWFHQYSDSGGVFCPLFVPLHERNRKMPNASFDFFHHYYGSPIPFFQMAAVFFSSLLRYARPFWANFPVTFYNNRNVRSAKNGRKKNATDFQKICGVAAWSIFNFHFHNVRGATAL